MKRNSPVIDLDDESKSLVLALHINSLELIDVLLIKLLSQHNYRAQKVALSTHRVSCVVLFHIVTANGLLLEPLQEASGDFNDTDKIVSTSI